MAVIDRRRGKKDELTPVQQLVRQIDQLQDLSAAYRSEYFEDPNWFKEIREFYNMAMSPVRSPSFRPQISVPQLQILSITEASDLADTNPKIYIVGDDQKRDHNREIALQAQWRDSHVNNQLMLSSLWSMLNGVGYIQPGFDPYGRRGKGCVWAKNRDPETVYPDPACESEDDWHYLILEDRMYPEEIRDRWPETSRGIKVAPPSNVLPDNSQMHSPGMQLTPGPMSVTSPNIPQSMTGPSDGRLRVRYLFIFDPTVVDVTKEFAGTKVNIDKVAPARFEKKYPNGRLMVEAEGVILFDGNNPHPNRAFPLVRVLGMPALSGFFAPPPLRITRGLQNTAERMFTQVFENAVRLNNGTWFIPDDAGISAESFGGLPGEIQVYNANAKKPELTMVKPFPPHMLEYPKFLLQLQKELQGFTPSRQGQQGSGNVGVDLFDAAVFQSQAMTRMRAKLMAESVYRLANQFFYLMAAYLKDDHFPDYTKEFEMVGWDKVAKPENYELYIDPSSVRPISQQAMQKMVPVLRKEGLLSAKTALELSDIPGAAEEADLIEKEKALEALSKIKKR